MRRYELDLCRILACFMVVMLHVSSSMWFIDPAMSEWQVMNFYDILVRAGVPLFFMISGSLFFSRETLDVRKFLKKNIGRIFFIFFIWSFLYELNNFRMNVPYDNVFDFLAKVIRGHYHFWYIPAMGMAYLCVPIIHDALKGNKVNINYMIGIFFLLSIAKTFLSVLPSKYGILAELSKWIDFADVRYLGYMLMGYKLSQMEITKSKVNIAGIVFVVVSVLAAIINGLYSIHIQEASELLYDYFSLNVFIQCCCIFIIFTYWKHHEFSHAKEIRFLSECTFGIYLLHPFVLEFITRRGITTLSFPTIIAIPILSIIIMVICFIVIAIMKKIIIINKIV